jgi:3-oxoacyl-(acyl-carrier-protein) synthase
VPERVVVTGLGVIAPNANGKEAFSSALRDGKSGIRVSDGLRDAGLPCPFAGIPEGIEELKRSHLSEEEILASNQSMALASIAAIDAWRDAGLSRPPEDSDDVDWDSGAIISTLGAGMDAVGERILPMITARKIRRITSTLVEQTLVNGNGARVAGVLALGNKVSTACTTGNDAVVEAFRHVRGGHAKRMLAGGSEGYSKYVLVTAHILNSLHHDAGRDAPEKASRPMSASASGFVPAAGAGMLLLESLSSAQSRGARIYAEVLGGFTNCGAHRKGSAGLAPNGDSLGRCIQAAVTQAGIRPEEIGAINGYLAGTLADPQEVDCWKEALALAPSKMPLIHATKSLIGHAFGAAGGIECVATVLELDEGFVHGSLNCEDLHPSLEAYADRIPHSTVRVPDLKVIAKASFGLGDVNACVVFRKFEH